MADELSETPGGATKGLLGALAFILILLGGEILVDKTGERLPLGLGLVAAGVLVFFAGFFWRWIQKRVATSIVRKVNLISADPMWWVAIFSVFTTFSLNQLGFVLTMLMLILIGCIYAVYSWRKASKREQSAASGFIVSAGTPPVQPPRNPQVDQDLLHLLDFGVYQTTLVMLSHLVSEIPARYNVDIEAPIPLEFANSHDDNSTQIYLQSVRRFVCDGSDRAARYEGLMRHAENAADGQLKRTPIDQRSKDIDPLVLRGYAISFRQAVFTANFLRNEKREIEEKIIHQRATMIERIRLRRQ